MKALLPRVAAVILAGATLAVVSPPVNLHWLHWLILVPVFWALRRGEGATNAILGWIAGFACVGSNFIWLPESIIRFSNVPDFLAYQVVHLFAFGFSIPYALVFGAVWWFRDRVGPWWIAIIPALQVLTEFWGPALFPYYHGVSQYRVAWTWQLASVTGVTGVSYLIFLTNCALAEILFRRREGRPFPAIPVAAAAAVFLANLGFGAWRSAAVEAEVATWPVARISQIQLGITMEERMSQPAAKTLQDWIKATQSLRGQEVDLVVWPEGATPYDPRQLRVNEVMGRIAETLDAPIIFGGGFAERKTDPETGLKYVEQRNSIYHMGTDGELITRYDKMVPLPFGEYLPFADTFPILKEIIKGPGDFEKGTEPVFFEGETGDGHRFSITTPICYEAILSRFVSDNLTGSDLFLNVTNDGWFGDTAAPHQHAMLSAVRAMELGTPMDRLAYTGISMLILPSGRILEETEPFTDVMRVIEVPVGHIKTVYRTLGDVFPWACTLLVIGAAGFARRRGVTPDAPPA
jgi:apolipoprotein N-acyltransferase